MFIAYIAVAIVLMAILVSSARTKLTGNAEMAASLNRIGVPASWLLPLALLEAAGGLGLLAGIAYLPLGITAGTAVVLYFLGAVTVHLRAGDRKGIAAPGVILVLAALSPVFGLAAL